LPWVEIAEIGKSDEPYESQDDKEKQYLEKPHHAALPFLLHLRVTRFFRIITGIRTEFTPLKGGILRLWQEVAQVRARLRKTVALVGLMGAGKTAVGTALARRLGVPFRDSDQEIVRAANMAIPEIFSRDGEAFFRRKEAQVIARLLREAPGILSTGGGAFLLEENRRAISDRGVSVWLNADLDLLWSRVRHKDTRPLLRTSNPYATLSDLYHARRPFYARADLVVCPEPQYSIDDMAEKVIEVLRTRPDVLETA